MITLSVEDGLLDLGDALVGDTISSNFKVRKGSFCSEQSLRTLLLFSTSGFSGKLMKYLVPIICLIGESFGTPDN